MDDLLKRPSEFKARAFLDAHRGKLMRVRSNRAGWYAEVRKLHDFSKPIPDIYWGTNCDRLTWQSSWKLMPATFSFYHYLLSIHYSLPLQFSSADIGMVIGSQRGYVLDPLAKARLICVVKYQGAIPYVCGVFRTPANAATMQTAKNRIRVRLEKPDGTVVNYYGNAEKFAREHGLDPCRIARVVSGEEASHKGWKLHHRLR